MSRSVCVQFSLTTRPLRVNLRRQNLLASCFGRCLRVGLHSLHLDFDVETEKDREASGVNHRRREDVWPQTFGSGKTLRNRAHFA
jgi:hypothetical protein